MQKRSRAVEAQKLRRTLKGRVKTADPVRDGVSVSLAYARLCLLWLSIISLDVLVGFRFELLWPFWLIVRAAYESCYKNTNSFLTLADNNAAKFSVLFVCVTATSDLMCYLFIPVQVLIFLASTYVWVHLVWHANGGFLRTIHIILHDRTAGVPVVVMWCLVVVFEVVCRMRCDLIILASPDGPLAGMFNIAQGCGQVQGVQPPLPRSLNAFFGAHAVGYPIVIAFFSLNYYFKEWRVGRRRREVGRRNEVLAKLLCEALPAVYDGPRDYSKHAAASADDLELDQLDAPSTPMIMPPPSHHNHTAINPPSSSSQHLQSNGNGVSSVSSSCQTAAVSTSTTSSHSSSQHGQQQQHSRGRGKGGAGASARAGKRKDKKGVQGGKTRKDTDRSEFEQQDEWSEPSANTTMPLVMRVVWQALLWLSWLVWPAPRDYEGSACGDEDDEEDDESVTASERPSRANGDLSSSCVSQHMMNGHSQHSVKASPQQTQHHHFSHHQPIAAAIVQPNSHNGTVPKQRATAVVAGKQTRPPRSRSDQRSKGRRERNESGSGNTAAEGKERRNASLEARLREEARAARSAADDARLQLQLSQNTEKLARQEASQLRTRIEQIEARLASTEKMRAEEKVQQQQLERRLADVQQRKNEVERELTQERKQRESKKSPSVDSEQQQRETALEREVDRLRAEAATRDEVLAMAHTELAQLRHYRETNDVESMRMELRVIRERNAHLEDALCAENKLKQELFRALGDAKAANQQLREQIECGVGSGGLGALSELSIRPPSHPSAMPDKPSPAGSQHHSPPPYNMATALPAKQPPADFFAPFMSFTQQHQTSPTGEHQLFESSSGVSLPCALSPHDPLITSRMGKFGAPSPAQTHRIN